MWLHMMGIMLMVVGFFYWQNAQKVKEIAWQATQRRCEQLELQRLDGYIALFKIRLQYYKPYQWRIVRYYQFEFSAIGDDRYQGVIVMLASQVESIQLEPYRIQ